MVAGPVLPMARSKTGVTVVITSRLVLLPGFVSGVVELTPAALVMEPLTGAFTVTVRLLTWPAFNVPKFQPTAPALVAPPPEALTKVAFVGRTSATMTPFAADGPKLVTAIV